MGRPVITTDWVGCRETVRDGVNGFLVPPRDVQQLAEVMQRFIKQPELIERMGQEGRRLAEQRFDVRVTNREILRAMGVLGPAAVPTSEPIPDSIPDLRLTTSGLRQSGAGQPVLLKQAGQLQGSAIMARSTHDLDAKRQALGIMPNRRNRSR